MFAMNGIIVKGGLHPELMPADCISRRSYELADAMLEARRVKEEPQGIIAIKKKRSAR